MEVYSKQEVPPYKNKSCNLDFNSEKERCLKAGCLFEDPDFPASDTSIFFKKKPKQAIEWKRPGELVDNPQFFVDKHSRFDVQQGVVSNCWFQAAVANLTLHDDVFKRVVPLDQSFEKGDYAGIFHFKFWRYGKWIDVVTDDRLPTVWDEDDQQQTLYSMHSEKNNEFWSALLEKAYAKLFGSYENLDLGTTSEALEDFTGGLTEVYALQETGAETVHEILEHGFQIKSLFGCLIYGTMGKIRSNGLVMYHVYSVTHLRTVKLSNGGVQKLVRLRNPWGNDKEWNWAWSDDSEEWDTVADEDKHSLQFTKKYDGEFWMSFDDFMTQFTHMDVCNLSAGCGVTDEFCSAKPWKEVRQDGSWIFAERTNSEVTLSTDRGEFTWMNPRYCSRFTVTNENLDPDGKCTAIVAVLHKHRRERRSQNENDLKIGISIFRATSLSETLPERFFEREVERSTLPVPSPTQPREITIRFRSEPGEYIIVPFTDGTNSKSEYLLRIFSTGEIKLGDQSVDAARD